jgi:Apea-like HEPN
MSIKGKRNIGELRPLARTLFEAYQAAEVKTDDEYLRVINANRGFYQFQGGLIERTELVADAIDALIESAMKLIGPKGASERALTALAEQTGRELIKDGLDLDAAVTSLIERFYEESNATYELVLPNYLIDLGGDVRSITIGRVRAAMTEDVAVELVKREIPVVITLGPELSQSAHDRKIHFTMPPCCWVVNVAAAKDNAYEEAKWLIDVAVSLLRLSYKIISPMFPIYGDVEPHPTFPWHLKNISVMIAEKYTTGGRPIGTKSYEIDKTIEAIVTDPAFLARAKLIFDPPKGSLAERFHQGLGWLTRARQSDDRAERLLYFFTAIEALLSTDDKSAPVVQTIARNAAAILTPDISARVKTAKKIRELYDLRSSVVHRGSRPVSSPQTQITQKIAEDLFWLVLNRVDLSMKHSAFNEQLSVASYGSPWPIKSDGIESSV